VVRWARNGDVPRVAPVGSALVMDPHHDGESRCHQGGSAPRYRWGRPCSCRSLKENREPFSPTASGPTETSLPLGRRAKSRTIGNRSVSARQALSRCSP
jgi:hypothetical protein